MRKECPCGDDHGSGASGETVRIDVVGFKNYLESKWGFDLFLEVLQDYRKIITIILRCPVE